jgi:hypothetical protein
MYRQQCPTARRVVTPAVKEVDDKRSFRHHCDEEGRHLFDLRVPHAEQRLQHEKPLLYAVVCRVEDRAVQLGIALQGLFGERSQRRRRAVAAVVVALAPAPARRVVCVLQLTACRLRAHRSQCFHSTGRRSSHLGAGTGSIAKRGQVGKPVDRLRAQIYPDEARTRHAAAAISGPAAGKGNLRAGAGAPGGPRAPDAAASVGSPPQIFFCREAHARLE